MKTSGLLSLLALCLVCFIPPLAAAQKNAYLWPHTTEPARDALGRRVPTPVGFVRERTVPGSFAEWLRNLPLKPGRPTVKLFNGQEKRNQTAHTAVFDIDVGTTDLQQCADAVMRLRAEYLYTRGLAQGNDFRPLHFQFTNGFQADFGKWTDGYRIRLNGNVCTWVRSEKADASYPTFRAYLNQVFTYAGTASLSRELSSVPDLGKLQAGDVFIQGGFPGHAVIVVDTAVHPQTRQKIFLLAQSYMPAQEIHLLRNPNESNLGPWYRIDFGETLTTPEWTFKRTDLKRFG